MLYQALIVRTLLSFSLLFPPSSVNERSDGDQQLLANVQIVQQKYCRADADLFTVSLRLKVEISNLSKSPILVRTPLVPYIAKVSSSITAAKSGQVLYELTQSHYPQNTTASTSTIAGGKAITVQTGYDFVARYHSEFSYPQSLSAGTFAVVLVLKPEVESSEERSQKATAHSVTTEPFMVRVDKKPKVVRCD